MKKTIQVLALVLAMCLALASCGAKPAEPSVSPEASSGDSAAEIVNPVREVTADEQAELTGVSLAAPAEATDLTYLVIDSGDESAPIAELDFTLNGQQYYYRAQAKDGGDAETLAGMHYEWTETKEDAEVDYCPASVFTVDSEEQAACVVWSDVVPGISYTLSAMDTADAEEMLAVANAAFVPAQGDAEGDEISEEIDDSDTAASAAFQSYDEVIAAVRETMANDGDHEAFEALGISYLYAYPDDPEAPFGYAFYDLNGDGSDELLMGVGGEYGFFVDGFAMVDGKLEHFLGAGGERDRYYLCEGNFLHEQGSSGAMNSFDWFFTFDGDMLQLVEEVNLNAEADEENPWFYVGEDGADEQPITEDEAMEILNKYTTKTLELTPFAE